MAYTHVGTKYIKRQQDFENFLKFRHTLVYTRVGGLEAMNVGLMTKTRTPILWGEHSNSILGSGTWVRLLHVDQNGGSGFVNT